MTCSSPSTRARSSSRVPWLGSNNLVHMISYWAWFGGSEEKWADYWSKFKVNVGRFEPKWGQLHQAVGLKEYPLGIFTLPYTQFAFGRSYGNKLGYAPIKKEPAIWFPNLVTVHKNAPHPNAAKLFVEYAISPEGQQAFIDEGNVPAAKGLKPRGVPRQAARRRQALSELAADPVARGDQQLGPSGRSASRRSTSSPKGRRGNDAEDHVRILSREPKLVLRVHPAAGERATTAAASSTRSTARRNASSPAMSRVGTPSGVKPRTGSPPTVATNRPPAIPRARARLSSARPTTTA